MIKPFNLIAHFWLHDVIKGAHEFCMSRKGGIGGGGWGHLQGDMHMVVIVAGYRNALVGTGCANSCHACTNVVSKRSLTL